MIFYHKSPLFSRAFLPAKIPIMPQKKSKTILAKPSLLRQRRSTLPQEGESKKVILATDNLSAQPKAGHLPKHGESNKVILAIETSCDETAAAVLEYMPGSKWPQISTRSSIINSQVKLHSKMGGVVPEAAARAHVKNIRPVVESALSSSHLALSAVDYIAVTQGPGLIPSLIVGVEFAKALGLAAQKPLIPVNHMLGHLYSPLARISNFPASPAGGQFPISEVKDKGLKIKDLFPQIALIVSGGHTILVLMQSHKQYKVLGQTVDDAAGEAFDKVAKLLGLPYPGGPEVSRLAAKGNPEAIKFPRPMLNAKNYDFSFSGLKTAVLYYVKDQGLRIKDMVFKADLCASFQAAAVDVLVQKTMRAAREFKAKSVSLSGGVSANQTLRATMQAACQEQHLEFFVPPAGLHTDNAEMIGIAAAFKLHQGFRPIAGTDLKADSNLEL